MEVAIQAGPDPTLANSRNIKNKPLADLCCERLRVQVSNKTKKQQKRKSWEPKRASLPIMHSATRSSASALPIEEGGVAVGIVAHKVDCERETTSCVKRKSKTLQCSTFKYIDLYFLIFIYTHTYICMYTYIHV